MRRLTNWREIVDETMKGQSMSKGLITGIVILVAVICGGGVYAYVNNKSENEKEDLRARIELLETQVANEDTAAVVSETSDDSATTTTAATAAADWKTYVNEKYGFSLTFNDKWTGYTVKDYPVTPDSRGGNALAMYQVLVPTSEKSEFWTSPWSPMFLFVYSPATWESVASLDGPKPKLISQNANYVVAYSTAQDAPQTDGVPIMQDINNVISTFKFSK